MHTWAKEAHLFWIPLAICDVSLQRWYVVRGKVWQDLLGSPAQLFWSQAATSRAEANLPIYCIFAVNCVPPASWLLYMWDWQGQSDSQWINVHLDAGVGLRAVSSVQRLSLFTRKIVPIYLYICTMGCTVVLQKAFQFDIKTFHGLNSLSYFDFIWNSAPRVWTETSVT